MGFLLPYKQCRCTSTFPSFNTESFQQKQREQSDFAQQQLSFIWFLQFWEKRLHTGTFFFFSVITSWMGFSSVQKSPFHYHTSAYVSTHSATLMHPFGIDAFLGNPVYHPSGDIFYCKLVVVNVYLFPPHQPQLLHDMLTKLAPYACLPLVLAGD